MWKRSWINIEMMLADQPKMVKKQTKIKKMSGAALAARHAAKHKNE